MHALDGVKQIKGGNGEEEITYSENMRKGVEIYGEVCGKNLQEACEGNLNISRGFLLWQHFGQKLSYSGNILVKNFFALAIF